MRQTNVVPFLWLWLGTATANPALLQWLKDREGSFSDKLEIRDNGVFAKKDIAPNEILLKAPPRAILNSQAKPKFEVGDRVEAIYRNEPDWFGATVIGVGKDGYDIEFDDGDEEYNVKEVREGFFLQCGSVRNLVKQVQLGQDSEYAPLLNDFTQQKPTIPSSWTSASKEIFLRIVGFYERRKDSFLPPLEPLQWSYQNLCNGEEQDESYAMLLIQYGLIGRVIPFYYRFFHNNAQGSLNTQVSSLYESQTFIMRSSSQPIKAGQEIFITHNFTPDFSTEHYGTPDLFRDFGVLEDYPRRWYFDEQEVSFDLIQQDGQVSLHWLDEFEPSNDAVTSMEKHLQRLHDLKDELADDQPDNVPDAEWAMIWQYHEALVQALGLFMEAAIGHVVGDCQKDTCPVALRYDSLESREDPFDGYTQVCNHDEQFKLKDHDHIELIHSPYQEIQYSMNHSNSDVCFGLDSIVQICGSYRPHYHEMVVHYTARFLPEIKRVVFVGGGDSMLLHEIMKYPSLELVVGLELDQKVTRAAFKHFGAQPHWDDPRVQWWYGDATKSLLMLPKDYFGSFDMVLVDLSETVMSMTVTEELDVMEAFSLLLKPEGILVKNELYFEKMMDVFEYTIQIHYYDVPVICSQCLILGSHKLNFMERIPKDHGVETLFLRPQAEIQDRFDIVHDYGHNDKVTKKHCKEKDEAEKEPIEQKRSPGILMILEAEQTSTTLKPANDLAKQMQSALKKDGLTIISSAISETNDGDDAIIALVFKEGYIVARAWPGQKYVAFDIHLWGTFDLQTAIQKSLVSLVGSTLVSTYRIVAGGMFGVETWKQDDKSKGPRITQYCESPDKLAQDSPMETHVVEQILSEALGFVQGSQAVALVLCAQDTQTPCRSVDVVGKNENIEHVVALRSCPSLDGINEYAHDSSDRMLACENALLKEITAAVTESGKSVGVIVIDQSAPRVLAQIVHHIFTPKRNQRNLMSPSILLLAPDATEDWRRNLLERFQRDIVRFEPAFRAEISFRSSESTIRTAVTSCGDELFMTHLNEINKRIEARTALVSQVETVLGGDVHFQEDFYPSQLFLPGDYDQREPIKQYLSQHPLGFQTVFQLEMEDSDANKINVGDKVIANYEEEGEWFPATVIFAHPDDTFDLEYDDGDEEDRAQRSMIQKSASPKHSLSELNRTSVKRAIETTLEKMESQGLAKAKIEDIVSVGDGSVIVAIWAGGIVVALWDGRIHLDINLFTYKESVGFADAFSGHVLAQTPNLKSVLRDEQPRGIGRVVNLVQDLESRSNPHWHDEAVKSGQTR